MALVTRPFDPSEYLDDPEAVAEYLTAAFESGDPAAITDAMGVVARAKGMSQLAEETGLSRPALYRALSSEGHPELATVMKVLGALGLKLSAARVLQHA
jgi:probable addiction module antidote protein